MHTIVTAESTTSAAARLVVRQLSELHPGIALILVVTDPLQPPTAVDGATVIAARNLTVGGLRYIDAWLGGGPAFARWAVVPAAFTALGSGENTLVLPAESRVAASLTDLTASHRADTVALFARRHDESAGVSSGGWLPDLAVIGSDAGAVMAWWDGLVRDALIGPGGVDLDDPWRDFAVAGDSIAVVTDSSVRLSPHSIRHLELGSVDSTTTVDGRPLRLAQFPAFAPDRPWWYSTSPDADPPVLASDSAALRRICRDHASDLIAATDDPVHGVTERANGVLGIRHTEPLRRAVRKRLRLAAATGEAIPNPLDADTAPEFFAWLRDPEDAELTGVNVAADLVWQERPDLANAFPTFGGPTGTISCAGCGPTVSPRGSSARRCSRACPASTSPRHRARRTQPTSPPAGSASGSTWSATTTPTSASALPCAGSPLRWTPRGSRGPR